MATPFINKVILAGRLTKDPELRYTASGTAVANFGLAANRRYRQGEETREETLFIDLVAFGRQAELVEKYLKKGSPIYLEGRLQQRKWEDQSGQPRTKYEIVAENIQFLDSGKPSPGDHDAGGYESASPSSKEEIPF
jgi:single-strand DNA-binding protein